VGEAISIIWRLSVATELIVVARLLFQGLGGVYPALLAGSCIFALRSSLLILSLSDLVSRTREAWRITEPLVWIMWAWIVLELFSKWTRSYPGIGRFGRYLFGVLVTVALLVSMIGWTFEWRALVFAHDFRIYYILNRVLMATLAVFTLLVWLFFRNYPAAVAPNALRHTQITVTYLATNALSQLAFTLNGLKVNAAVNLLIVVATFACFSAWAVFLTRKGEVRSTVPAMEPAEVARIEQVNRELLGLMKKLPG
jgi:hypothetical protein